MIIASEDIMIDCDNPSRERLIIRAIDITCPSEMWVLINQKVADGWHWESDYLAPNALYLIFTRSIRTEIDWYARLIEHYPDMLFIRA